MKCTPSRNVGYAVPGPRNNKFLTWQNCATRCYRVVYLRSNVIPRRVVTFLQWIRKSRPASTFLVLVILPKPLISHWLDLVALASHEYTFFPVTTRCFGTTSILYQTWYRCGDVTSRLLP